jgi:hypothetical protein
MRAAGEPAGQIAAREMEVIRIKGVQKQKHPNQMANRNQKPVMGIGSSTF